MGASKGKSIGKLAMTMVDILTGPIESVGRLRIGSKMEDGGRRSTEKGKFDFVFNATNTNTASIQHEVS